MRRSSLQKVKDFVTFPLRAITLFWQDKWGLSSLASERFDHVAREVIGYCLDVGCGPDNRFINQYLNGHGKGIDVFMWDALSKETIVGDLTRFSFDDATFDSVAFIASINHIPKSLRDIELAEAYRCLKPQGNIVVTMGSPLAEILVHKIVRLYDKLFGTNYDIDSKRGMHEEEAYYLRDSEIIQRLTRAGFVEITKKYFFTQWALNHQFIGWKR